MVCVAICFHLGYSDRFDEFTPYIDNVIKCCGMCDIYITYREKIDPHKICHVKYPDAVLIRSTHGCDTGAFLLQINAMLKSNKNYDYIFKIHTKSNNPVYTNWKNELLDNISGSVDKVAKVIKLFTEDNQIGAVGCKKWVLNRDVKFSLFMDTSQRTKISPNGFFVGGTIFWMRFSVVSAIFKSINIRKEYRLCEKGKPSEPSYTHSWERLFGLAVNTAGFYIKGI